MGGPQSLTSPASGQSRGRIQGNRSPSRCLKIWRIVSTEFRSAVARSRAQGFPVRWTACNAVAAAPPGAGWNGPDRAAEGGSSAITCGEPGEARQDRQGGPESAVTVGLPDLPWRAWREVQLRPPTGARCASAAGCGWSWHPRQAGPQATQGAKKVPYVPFIASHTARTCDSTPDSVAVRSPAPLRICTE